MTRILGPEVISKRLGDTSVLVDVRTTRIFELNSTGTRVWELLSEGAAEDQVVHRLVEEFDVDHARAAREVGNLIERLRHEGTPHAMTSQILSQEVQSRTLDIGDGAWVLPISLADPGCILPGSGPWLQQGSLRGFVKGHFADRRRLAAAAGYNEACCSDAELLLRLYDREGEGAFERLRGSFVGSIIDCARGLAIVLRDPLGSHPLFYSKLSSVVLFAASPPALLNQPGVSRSMNRAALADHLCHRWPDAHETFFSAVRRVLPGWRILITSGQLAPKRYWHAVPPDRPIDWLPAHETGRFDHLLDWAVDRGLARGPTGIFLSGGLNSISVAAVATDRARLRGEDPPIAFSLAFPDPACDERVRQASVARDLGLRLHLIDIHEAVGRRPLLEQTLELNQSLAAPVLNAYLPAYVTLLRLAKAEGVRTIFTGQGGDEWLSVTPFLCADLLRRGEVLDLVYFLGSLLRSYHLDPIAIARNALWNGGLRPLAGMALSRLMPEAHDAGRLKRLLRGDPTWLTPDQYLRAAQRVRAVGMLTPADPPHGFYRRELQTTFDHALTSWEAEEQYAIGTCVGVDYAHPYWDPDLIEMMIRTTPRVLNDGGRTKGLVRQTLHRRFPNIGLEQQRKVYATSFYDSLLLREGPSLAAMAGDFPTLSELGIVDGRALGLHFRQQLTSGGVQSRRLWLPLNLEMWLRAQHGV